MTPESVVALLQQALMVLVTVAAPPLVTALVVGLVISIFQAATQINEMTLSFIPKLLAMFVVLIVAAPWMIETMTDFTRRLFELIPQMAG
ncbi:MAG: flagellar biosynthesis protein FliQ [Burkholderiales bacterium]|jgi:flagellar biosynthesis protein FliQ|nr:flagellar biosynthesis protein FliQ [Burkholderiales bacterium]